MLDMYKHTHIDIDIVIDVSSVFQGINECQLVNRIASGGFGVVYMVKMINLDQNQEAALKVFSSFGVKRNKYDCEREKLVLKYIAVHERNLRKELNIAHIRTDIDGISCPNLMIEYIHGFDLSDDVLEQYSFPALIDFVKHLMNEIGFGVLNDLHSMGIYHNDLKPNNIMFDTDNELFYLIDFGLALSLELLSRSPQQNAKYLTTLRFNSPWHLKIVRQSQYRSYGCYRYKIQDGNATRLYAANADFYSFGLTIIRIIGKHCRGNDPLCSMAQRILMLQEHYFARVDTDDFVSFEITELERIFVGYWQRVHDLLADYRKENPNQHMFFISTLSNWLRLVRDKY